MVSINTISGINDFPLHIGLSGYSGHLYIENALNHNSSIPDFILPSPSAEENEKSLLEEVKSNYLNFEFIDELCDDERVPLERMWETEWNEYSPDFEYQPSPATTSLEPLWLPPWKRGKDLNNNSSSLNSSSESWLPPVHEVDLPNFLEESSSSSSMIRRPGAVKDFVRGSSKNHPFFPGGFQKGEGGEGEGEGERRKGRKGEKEWVEELMEGGPFLSTPPGFTHGANFSHLKEDLNFKFETRVFGKANDNDKDNKKNQTLKFETMFKGEWESEEEEEEEEEDEGEGEEEEEGDKEKEKKEKKEEEKKIEVSQSKEGFEMKNDDKMEKEKEIKEMKKEKELDKERQKLKEDLAKNIIEKRNIEEIKSHSQALENLLNEISTFDLWWLPKKQKKLIPMIENQQNWAIMDRIENLDKIFSKIFPTMAMSFPFELDMFQKEAVIHLENHESVFVAAHTSAGKTVVAEYAFALSTKHCTRAIYTSPIKAISNQKFRDFGQKFDVGLLTGDVSMNPDASCLIMTTEILRSMLYRGADILRDVEWVVFDEVHYVNDLDRGVVWEEVIIMLPDHIGLILLSATVPNTFDFADWIGRTKKKKIYVTGTTKRPVPLEHNLFYSGNFYKICENEKMLPLNIKAAHNAHKLKNSPSQSTGRGDGRGGRGDGRGGRGDGRGGRGEGRGRAKSSMDSVKKQNLAISRAIMTGQGQIGRKSESSQWNSFIQLLGKHQLLPVVVFCFSKNKCDEAADCLRGSDLTSGSEKNEISKFCKKAFSCLRGSDQRLPQILRISELLKRGIGVHHAGLLPIVKEVVEMLFCRGIIKVLFSTETFAMGVNAPARSVAFHSLRKHDGRSFRQILSGEYTQMAGRAGRRGLDKVGTVLICCWDDIPEDSELTKLLTGKPTKLESQFRLTYNMILNLLRVEDCTVEDMLKRSFAEFHAQRALPKQKKLLTEGEGALSELNDIKINCIFGDPTIEEYYDISFECEELNTEINKIILNSRFAIQTLTCGRIVITKMDQQSPPLLSVILKGPYGEGINRSYVTLSIFDSDNKHTRHQQTESSQIKSNLTILGMGSKGIETLSIRLPYCSRLADNDYIIDRVELTRFDSICKVKVNVHDFDVDAILNDQDLASISSIIQKLQNLKNEFSPFFPPSLDPRKDLKFNDISIVEKYQKREILQKAMMLNPCHSCSKLNEHYSLMKKQNELQKNIQRLKFAMSDASLQQMPDFNQRVDVLQRLDYIDSDRVVQIKGRVACEINSADELIATECIFENQLEELSAEETVALLSSLVFQQKDASPPDLTPNLAMACDKLYSTAVKLAELQIQCGLPIVLEEYINGALKFGLVQVVYEWAKGTPFAEICELTNVAEGTIVRTILRLDETCREVRNAARIVGNPKLVQTMEAASTAIKRDIVFAASLYVSGTV